MNKSPSTPPAGRHLEYTDPGVVRLVGFPARHRQQLVELLCSNGFQIECDLPASSVESVGSASVASLRPDSGAARRPTLARRETEVLIAYALDDPAGVIAHRLGISRHTVETYLKRIRRKYESLGRPARTRVALLRRAMEDGLLLGPAA